VEHLSLAILEGGVALINFAAIIGLETISGKQVASY
jgi:hypothetical protein